MIFTCEKQNFLEAITIVQKAITGKSTMQILEGIYIYANDSELTLIGSDLDVSIQTKVNVNVIDSGEIVIDAKIFAEIIRKLPNSTIKIETLDNQVLRISCEKSVFDITYINADEYPKLPEINETLKISLNQNILKNMIKGTVFAIAQDETRPILQGILFQIKDKSLNLVALDGYRLAIKNEYIESDTDIEVVIPGKTLNEISKILEDTDEIVDITFTENHILFNLEKTKIISRLLDGKFISYASLLPEEHKLLVYVNREQLQNSIERASLMAKDGNTNLIKLDFNQDNLIISSNSQLGKVREELSIKMQGEDIKIAFNSKYLLDVLKNIESDEVVMKMASSITPCVIEEKDKDNAKYLVLPVRLMR